MKFKPTRMETRIPQSSGLKIPERIAREKTQLALRGGGGTMTTTGTSIGVKPKNENQAPAALKFVKKVNREALQEAVSLGKPVTAKTKTTTNVTASNATTRQPLTTRSKTGLDLNNATARVNTVKPSTSRGPAPRVATVATKSAKKVVPATTSRGATAKTPTTSKTATSAKTTGKRIPAYDYKARFFDLQEKHEQLKEKFKTTKEQLGIFEDLPEMYEQTKEDLETEKQENQMLKQQIVELSEERDGLKVKNNSLVVTFNEIQIKLRALEEKCPMLEREVEELTCERNHFKKSNIELDVAVKELTEEMTKCQEQLFQANYERKDLHNMVMDLRGNIRVFCRVRPPLSMEGDRALSTWNYLDEQSLELVNFDTKTNKQSRNEFGFDHVFHQNSAQEDIFMNVSPLIQSALDGYNVCIFAYGQTGSGKTYTMDGDDIEESQLGVIPRTVHLLFDSIRNYKRLGWEYDITVQFLEIYNENLYDLLDNTPKELEIRMVSATNKTDVFVQNLTEETVANENELRRFMHIAKHNRMTAATIGNERSSRSHAVTKIKLVGTHKEKQEKCIGNINLVDLAGSESPKLSVRMDETKSINKSLSELSNVILALVQKQDHIPYRNSKLTHLLMPSLGGNSKTLMFVNVAPFTDCHQETVKSLRFASTVNSCKLQKAKKNRVLNQM